jgi:hypothetical protein
MKPTYRVLRERRGDGATLDTVADDLRCALPLATSARCMNPECSEICEWSPRRGRPPLFHDRLCHERYHLVRRRLVEEREDIFEALARKPGPSTSERIYLENQLARRRWLLERYCRDASKTA